MWKWYQMKYAFWWGQWCIMKIRVRKWYKMKHVFGTGKWYLMKYFIWNLIPLRGNQTLGGHKKKSEKPFSFSKHVIALHITYFALTLWIMMHDRFKSHKLMIKHYMLVQKTTSNKINTYQFEQFMFEIMKCLL
jgi:hypothetical protein